MNISIVGRHITITEDLREHIEKTIDVFKKYNLDIISINTVVSQEQKNKKNIVSFEYVINIAHQDTIVVKQKDKDIHAAIDIATDRVSKILRRHADKVKSHKKEKLTQVVIQDEEDKIALELDALENEIVPVKLSSYKPMEIADALQELKDDGGIFKVFYDLDDNLRVLYKLKDGSKFGLY